MTGTLIFLVTEDWYFYSHRLPMARAAKRAGFDVAVITNVRDHGDRIAAEGVRVIPLSLERRSLNPLGAARQIAALAKIYRREKPVLVHHVAMKPVLYGSIAAKMARIPHVLNAFAGLGFVFLSDAVLAQALRAFTVTCFRFLLRRPGSWVLFQNNDDRAKLEALGILDPARTVLIRGSGVDVRAYPARDFPPSPPFVCVFAGRMIAMKGLGTMRDAFAIIGRKATGIELRLCGMPDPANPGAWDESALRDWSTAQPHVTWMGQCPDMGAVWAGAHLALLPSDVGEGVPKALLEAAASARPIVTTDVPGCRELVADGVNGLLVPPMNGDALARAIMELAADPARAAAMGRESRKMVEGELSADGVTDQTEKLYRRIVAA